jgi:hypothetical protein
MFNNINLISKKNQFEMAIVHPGQGQIFAYLVKWSKADSIPDGWGIDYARAIPYRLYVRRVRFLLNKVDPSFQVTIFKLLLETL